MDNGCLSSAPSMISQSPTLIPPSPTRVSWRHPRSEHWHQLDLVITRRTMLTHVLRTGSYHSADCDTDHSLVVSMVRLRPRQIHHSKQKGWPRIDIVHTCRFSDLLLMMSFNNVKTLYYLCPLLKQNRPFICCFICRT